MLDLDSLDWQTFEALAIMLLRRESYKVTSRPAPGRQGFDSGVDVVANSPNDEQTFVIIKHWRHARTANSQARHTVNAATRLREQFPEANVLLITSADLTRAFDAILHVHGVTLWDRAYVQHLLSVHADIASIVAKKARDRDLNDLLREPEEPPVASLESRVTAELAAIPPGREKWKLYEDTAAKVLTEIYVQYLDPPVLQSRTDDDLDIMDAIFDIPYTDSPWSQVRTTYKTHFVVAEFKNYADSVGPPQVRQLDEYLWPEAFRMFGILVSRKGPNDQALAARRKAWLRQKKVIVFLDDDSLVEMARLVDDGRDPYRLIHEQLMDFFRALTP
ncbi:restriction endonuclease [Nocardia gamkensis]|uniref:Restriction endonuclease n=1 Tax=Nocardia gamkensis TaxID=352869 RepID=A0A7X6L0B8_9NOCA|nr:restriction endonuclease [Nocardia gamkensis]NKY25515.1 restriction endonuclease [Nocardia gamkensis]